MKCLVAHAFHRAGLWGREAMEPLEGQGSTRECTRECYSSQDMLPWYYPQVVSEVSLQIPLCQKLDTPWVRCMESQWISKLQPEVKTTGMFFKWQLRINYIHPFPKARGGKREKGGQRMEAHHKMHNFKKEGIFQYELCFSHMSGKYVLPWGRSLWRNCNEFMRTGNECLPKLFKTFITDWFIQ